MKIFEKKFYWYSKYNSELNYLPIVNFVFIAKGASFFYTHWIGIQLVVLFVIILVISRNKGRVVYKVIFSDNKQLCTIFYYRYIFWKRSASIPYYLLKYEYYKQRVGHLSAKNTLVFKNQDKYIAEIMESRINQWKDRDLKDIIAVIDSLSID